MAAFGVLNRPFASVRRWLARGEQCLLCDADAGSSPICPACEADLPRLPAHCAGCALPVAGGTSCGACLATPPAYDATVCAFAYRYPADRLVHALKYRARLPLSGWFARQLDARLRERRARPPVFIPVPLHRSRLAGRGFNQSAEIARSLASLGGGRLLVAAVERVRPTAAQADLPIDERAKNVRGAFRCLLPLEGPVAIVDDVMTTGATLHELARTLKQAGASHVTNVVVARTLIDH